MKKLIFLVSFLIFGLTAQSQKSTVSIAANDKIELDYPEIGEVNLNIKNRSSKSLDVKIYDKSSGKRTGGFGLGPLGKVDVFVKENGKIVISNDTDSEVNLALIVTEAAKKEDAEPKSQYIQFTFKNTSLKPIPLLIPSVMNPNLVPLSNSGVRLKIGQEVLFKSRGKKYVLLTVNDSYEQGTVIDIPKLLKARKKELGI